MTTCYFQANIDGATICRFIHLEDFSDYDTFHREVLNAYSLPPDKRYSIIWGFNSQNTSFPTPCDLSCRNDFENFRETFTTSQPKDLYFKIIEKSDVLSRSRCDCCNSLQQFRANQSKISSKENLTSSSEESQVASSNDLLKHNANDKMKPKPNIVITTHSPQFKALQRELSKRDEKIKLLETANDILQAEKSQLTTKMSLLEKELETLKSIQAMVGIRQHTKESQYTELHPDAFCDACQDPEAFIKGSRYGCMKCENYDLCSRCYHSKKSSNNHSPSHMVSKIRSNISIKNDKSEVVLKSTDEEYKSLAIVLLSTYDTYGKLSNLKKKADKYDCFLQRVVDSVEDKHEYVKKLIKKDMKKKKEYRAGRRDKSKELEEKVVTALERVDSRVEHNCEQELCSQKLSKSTTTSSRSSQQEVEDDSTSEIDEEEFKSVLTLGGDRTLSVVNFDSEEEIDNIISDEESAENASIGSYDILSTDGFTE